MFSAAVWLMALQGCGQSGDLYLPDEKPKAPPATQAPVAVTPVESASEAEAEAGAAEAAPDAAAEAPPSKTEPAERTPSDDDSRD